ncbi:MAG: hypothetical protein LUE27_04825 [Clostridia bacterium]|nr:hypothetical protein [Clostridia bacterium]
MKRASKPTPTPATMIPPVTVIHRKGDVAANMEKAGPRPGEVSETDGPALAARLVSALERIEASAAAPASPYWTQIVDLLERIDRNTKPGPTQINGSCNNIQQPSINISGDMTNSTILVGGYKCVMAGRDINRANIGGNGNTYNEGGTINDWTVRQLDVKNRQIDSLLELLKTRTDQLNEAEEKLNQLNAKGGER